MLPEPATLSLDQPGCQEVMLCFLHECDECGNLFEIAACAVSDEPCAPGQAGHPAGMFPGTSQGLAASSSV